MEKKTSAQIAAEEYASSKWSEDSREPLSGLECDIWKGAKEDYEAGYNTATLKWSDEDMRNAYNAGIDNGYSSEEDVVFYSAEEWLANYKKED